MGVEFEVFRGKQLDGLFKDIYNNQKTTQSQITTLIDILKPLIQTTGDAATIVPLIRDYLDVSVQNDGHLVRLAAIIQRLYAVEKLGKSGSSGEGMLSDEEKAKLYAEADRELSAITSEVKEDTKKIEDRSTAIKNEVKKLVLEDTEIQTENAGD